MPAGFPKSRGRCDNCVISLCVFLECLFFEHLPGLMCLWPPGSSASAGRRFLYPSSKSRRRWDLPSFRHKRHHLYRAGLVACSSELLSHTIVFWAFCKAPDYFRRAVTMGGCGSSSAGPPPGPLGPLSAALAFVWRRARGSPQAPRLKNAARFNISFQFTAWEEVGYNIGERLHLLPFCVWLCCGSNFVQAVCYSCVPGDSLRAPFPHLQTSTEISRFLCAGFST